MLLVTSYALFEIDPTSLRLLREEVDFDRLERDLSHPTGGRYRRYSELSIEGDEVALRDPRPFRQPDSFGYRRPVRQFAPLLTREGMQGIPNLIRLIRAVSKELDYLSGTIAVHAIRVCARRDTRGTPVPEGLHRDGFRWVAILVCDCPTVAAHTKLVSVRDACVLEIGPLRPGEMLLFSDEKFLHYTGEFSAGAHEELKRDVLILTVE